MENNQDAFTATPDLIDLINFLQFETIIEVPTDNGTKDLTVALLWEGEEYEIIKKSARDNNVSDMVTRTEFMKIETLVQAIRKINEDVFYSDSPKENKVLKDGLRMYLLKFSSKVIQYIYECYNELCAHRDMLLDQQTDELKKKLRERILVSTQTSITSQKQSGDFEIETI